MTADNDKLDAMKMVGGGFGRQVASRGKPSTISPIVCIRISFDEFMEDAKEERVRIRNYDEEQKAR